MVQVTIDWHHLLFPRQKFNIQVLTPCCLASRLAPTARWRGRSASIAGRRLGGALLANSAKARENVASLGTAPGRSQPRERLHPHQPEHRHQLLVPLS